MSLLIAAALTIIGFILLMSGGDRLVVGASAIARRFGLSDLFIGIAIVGFGTSLPELMAIITAMRNNAPDIALGNILGSNIANIGLIMGCSLLLLSGKIQLPENRRDYALMLLGFLLINTLFICCGVITWPTGLGLLTILAAYLWFSAKNGHPVKPTIEEEHLKLPLWQSSLYVVAGLLALLVGAEFLIDGATTIARHLGVTERIIGLTLVALGTSLPELAAAIAAARRNNISITAGNVLGSNLFNILAGSSVAALVMPLPLGAFAGDLSIMLLFGLLLMPLFLKNGIHARSYGLILLALYGLYIATIL